MILEDIMLNSIFKNSLEIPVIKLSGVIGQTGMFRSGINLFSLNKLIEKAFSGKKTKAVSLLINSPGQTFSREQIGKLIKIDKERSIDVIITRLRKKIEDDPKNPKYLQTIRGAGYVLWME